MRSTYAVRKPRKPGPIPRAEAPADRTQTSHRQAAPEAYNDQNALARNNNQELVEAGRPPHHVRHAAGDTVALSAYLQGHSVDFCLRFR